MINCDYFEDSFNTWKAGKLPADQQEAMEQHASTCPYCGKLSAETINLRVRLASMPRIEPSSTFEFRLQRRLTDIRKKARTATTSRKALLPKWSVVSAGLVTGLVVGILLIFPSNSDRGLITTTENSPAAAIATAPAVDLPSADDQIIEMREKSVKMLGTETPSGKMHIRGSRAGAVAFQPNDIIATASRGAALPQDQPEAFTEACQIMEMTDDSTKDTDSIEVLETPFDPDRHGQKVSHEKE